MRIGAGLATTVTDIAQWLAAIQAGQAFMNGGTIAGGAAGFAELQLFNPLASGKTVTIRFCTAAMGGAGTVQFQQYNTALATDLGAGINLLSGGVAGVAHVRSAGPAAIDGTQMFAVNILASTPFTPIADWIFQLAPGQGFHMAAAAVNQTLVGGYMWMEK